MACKFCAGATHTYAPFEVRTQRGNMINVVFNYCPACGKPLSEEAIKNRRAESFDIVVDEMARITARLRSEGTND